MEEINVPANSNGRLDELVDDARDGVVIERHDDRLLARLPLAAPQHARAGHVDQFGAHHLRDAGLGDGLRRRLRQRGEARRTQLSDTSGRVRRRCITVVWRAAVGR